MKKKVFYDGSCKLCRNEIQFYSKKIAKDKFEWINIVEDKKEVKCSGVSKKNYFLNFILLKATALYILELRLLEKYGEKLNFLSFSTSC